MRARSYSLASSMGLCLAAVGSGALAQEESGKKIDEVVVTGVRPLLGDKLPLTVQNTPQSVTVIGARLLSEQAVTRLEDALRNVPGITLNAGEGAARGDTVNIRGFSAFNDFFLDGVRDAAVYTRDSFNLDSVEVIKGPSAVLFGRGSTGGAINQVSKAPSLTPFGAASVEAGTNNEVRGTADVDVAIGPTTALRLNIMGETSGVADRDYVQNRRWGVAPALAFGVGRPTSLILTYLHQQEDDRPDSGVPFVNGRPADVPRAAFYGLISDRTTTRDDIATAHFKHDFSSQLSLTDTLRYGHYDFDYQFNSPNFGANPPTTTTPIADILVGRDAPDSSGVQTNLTDQLELTARFATGPVTHTLVAGAEVSRETSDLVRYVNPFNANNAWIPQTPLLDPDPFPGRPREPAASLQNTTANSVAAYLIDTIGLGDHFNLIASMRYDRFAADYDQVTLATGARLKLSHVDNLGSPRVALVFKPAPTQSYYLSYGTSFDPSAEALALTTKTANLGPVKAKTYEAGGKLRWEGMALTGAVFRTEVDNAQTNDPDNPTLAVLEGDQRVVGVELGATGHLTSRLEVTAGYTWLDGKTIASGTPDTVGRVMPNAARNAANLWMEYHLTPQWEVGIGGNYLGARFADAANTATVPAYVVVNAMTSYEVTPRLKVQLNVQNLTNKLYYDAFYFTSAAENHVIPGPGRTVKLTARVTF